MLSDDRIARYDKWLQKIAPDTDASTQHVTMMCLYMGVRCLLSITEDVMAIRSRLEQAKL